MANLSNKQRVEDFFINVLPELSKGWQPPPVGISLEMSLIKGMISELSYNNKGKPAKSWRQYYGLVGVNYNSDRYVIPSETHSRAQNDIIGDHLVNALWPLIKQGKRIQSPLKHKLSKFYDKVMMMEGGSASLRISSAGGEEWCWVIYNAYYGWHSHVRDTFYEQLSSRYEDTIIDFEALSGIKKSVFNKVLYPEKNSSAEFAIRCFNWWLGWQEIWLEPDEVEVVLGNFGICKTRGGDWYHAVSNQLI